MEFPYVPVKVASAPGRTPTFVLAPAVLFLRHVSPPTPRVSLVAVAADHTKLIAFARYFCTPQAKTISIKQRVALPHVIYASEGSGNPSPPRKR